MKRLLKALAISFGGGLALGAGIRIGQASVKSRPRPDEELDPLRQRLEDVEGRVVRVETSVRTRGDGPPAPLGAQNAEIDSLQSEIGRVDQKIGELESRLPAMISRDVNARIVETEIALRQELEEVHNRAVHALVETLQTNVMQRMSVFERSLAEQSRTIDELRQSTLRSDQNLQKMLTGIELLREQRDPVRTRSPLYPEDSKVETRAVSSEGSPVRAVIPAQKPVETAGSGAHEVSTGVTPATANPRRWQAPLISVLLGTVVLAGLSFAARFVRKQFMDPRTAAGQIARVAPVPTRSDASLERIDTSDVRALRERLSGNPGDPALLLELGREYVRRKDWPRAEGAYRSVLQTSPRNRDALLGLSDVLYQQHKLEESAAVLNRLSAGQI